MQQGTGNKKQETAEQPGFRKLLAWQRADDLACEVFRLSRRIPRTERWFMDQFLRAGLSVTANIAEGSGPSTISEFIRFLEIAARSLNEVEYYLHFLERNGILPADTLVSAGHLRVETGRLLFRLTESLRKKASDSGTWHRDMLREPAAEYLIDDMNDQ